MRRSLILVVRAQLINVMTLNPYEAPNAKLDMTSNASFRRPLPISILAIFFILLGLLTAYAAVMSMIPEYERNFPLTLRSYVLSSSTGLLTGIGLWRMRLWAFPIFFILWLANMSLALASRAQLDFRGFFGLSIMIVLFLCYRRLFIAKI
jgi:hypothetical protein